MLRHCASVRATIETTRVGLELASAQLAGLEAYAKAGSTQATARIELPPSCASHDPHDCARQSTDAVLMFGGMAGNRQACRGCAEELTVTA